ncbi:MAG: dihydroorotase, partial [Candidatus Dormibacteraceae bacterium]
VVDMPNTIPAVSSAAALEQKVEHLSGRARVDFALWGALRQSSAEEDLRGLVDAGVIGIKAYLGYAVRLANEQIVYTPDPGPGLEAPPDYGTIALMAPFLARDGMPLSVHAEDPGVLRAYRRPIHAYGDLLASRPAVAEAIAVAALGVIARESGCRIHVVHLSSASGLAAARVAIAGGAPLVVETCPQYLLLTDQDVAPLGAVGKMFPPVRTAADRRALQEGLLAGTITRIATDHAPHERAQKVGLSLEAAGAGSPGVETVYLAALEVARELGLGPEAAVQWVAEAPARALRLAGQKGAIRVGLDADLVLLDPTQETVASADRLHSKQPLGVFTDHRFRGAIRAVWSRGSLVSENGEPAGSGGGGRFLRPGPVSL